MFLRGVRGFGSWPEIPAAAEGDQKWILERLLKIEK
jgi:hypothetical protein